ncbi:olfactory receptor 2G3-like [Tachyglossus aculeatus]|uniref:olfactory receptor 2G3-like n=1 Tax=Tachyglossus aculeatus TaxID=9261 RepID=UPI0018F3D97F|nr:olfactory receptor 2G3-like [Tachyglossus aculeatus]
MKVALRSALGNATHQTQFSQFQTKQEPGLEREPAAIRIGIWTRMMRNGNSYEDFVLVGFSAQPQLEKILFVVVLIFYLLTSLVYFCFTTSFAPQLLWNLKEPSKTITVVSSVVQLYVSLALVSTECILLAIMASDCYSAVCLPLHYTTVMHSRLCRALVALASEIQLFVGTLVLILLPLSLIMVSYGSIVRVMLRIKSPQVWRKTLGTCGSHFLVITLFYGSILVVHIWPNSSFSGTSYKFLTLFNTAILSSMWASAINSTSAPKELTL